ncbi:uncharacterized protein LOC117111749 [Anneissia japonica]|uniref:uncharacterized protein LOC117111749 n=1 Tax=Anneissia japonica TaxID=1529436 RepID=UPI001425B1BC|nr:uncharacterized protein LOC117111749 [Anneissia japonica]
MTKPSTEGVIKANTEYVLIKTIVEEYSTDGHLVVNCIGWNAVKPIVMQQRNCIIVDDSMVEAEVKPTLLRIKEELAQEMQEQMDERGLDDTFEDDSFDESHSK